MRLLADSVSIVYLGVVALIAYVVLLWVALAFYIVRDARRRTPSVPFQLFAVVLGFVPPFLGALVYFVVRPPHTLDEERALALEEQALTDPGDENSPRPCPSCGRDIEGEFVICPYCRTQFARRCGSCGHSLRLGWSVCPYCAEEVGVHALSRSTRSRPMAQ